MDMVCKTLKLSKPVKTDILTTKYVFKKYSSLCGAFRDIYASTISRKD